MWCKRPLWRKVNTPVQSILSWRTWVSTFSFRFALPGTAFALDSRPHSLAGTREGKPGEAGRSPGSALQGCRRTHPSVIIELWPNRKWPK
jgi:hypothetical protein